MNLAIKMISISEVSRLTGSTRETITKKLDGLPFERGKQMEKLFNARDALRAYFLGDGKGATTRETLELKKVDQIDLDMEIKRNERVPLEDIMEHNRTIVFNVAGILKATLNKVFTPDRLEEIMAEMRRMEDALEGYNVKQVAKPKDERGEDPETEEEDGDELPDTLL